MNLTEIQNELRAQKLDGWLFFDHHQRDPIAYRVLGFSARRHVTRRWYYLLPAEALRSSSYTALRIGCSTQSPASAASIPVGGKCAASLARCWRVRSAWPCSTRRTA